MPVEAERLAAQVGALFAGLPQVVAVALGGSRAGGSADADSDIDLYVYTRGEIPLAERERIVAQSGGAVRSSLDLTYWGPGDEWIHAPSGIEVDIVYFEATWMDAQIARVVEGRQASLGYSTCFWHTVRRSRQLADAQGWFAGLQQRCAGEYPEALRRNIIALNRPVLREVIPAYAGQLEKAVRRGDLVSVNHRLAALFASYFDILFALNRELHPGEKRLAELAAQRCARLPETMQADIAAVFEASSGAGLERLPGRVERLLDRLDRLLAAEGFGSGG